MLRHQVVLFLLVIIFAAAAGMGCGTDAGAEPGPSEPEVPAEPSVRQEDIVLYLPASEGRWLEEHEATVEVRGEAPGAIVLAEWVDRVDALPTGVKAEADLQRDTMYVSFSDQIRELSLEAEPIVVKSLVHTMSALEGTEKVQILIDGKRVETLAGNSFVGEPLTRDDSVLATEEFRPMEPADPREGEQFIYAEIVEVGVAEGWVQIEQHMGDARDEEVDPRIDLAEEVVIHLQMVDADGDLSYSMLAPDELRQGMLVGIILDPEGNARGMVVEENN